MKHPIGFGSRDRVAPPEAPAPRIGRDTAPVRSIVQVRFRGYNIALSYYNDQFNLKVGDIVFVDGKYAGCQGRVEKISTHFKVKLEDYKRVLSVADTKVMGQFYQANDHMIAFEKSSLQYEQVRSWFFPPEPGDAEYFIGYDDDFFELSDLSGLNVGQEIFERGVDYYRANRVLCVALDGESGRAIVDGTHPYELEFQYSNGRISNLICNCPYSANCKHEVAAMLQLRETLEVIVKRYAAKYSDSNHFVAVYKPVFYAFAIDSDSEVCLTLF